MYQVVVDDWHLAPRCELFHVIAESVYQNFAGYEPRVPTFDFTT